MTSAVEDAPIAEAFALIIVLAEALGMRSIKDLPGLWTVQVDALWRVSVNGHATVIDGAPPYHAVVEYKGWPAGCFSARGGFFADGAAANEHTFIDALRARIERERKAAS